MSNNTMYSEKVMDHFRNPRNVGVIENASGIGHVGNPVCGDIMELYIKVKDGVITDAKFKTFGCLPAQEEVVSEKAGWLTAKSLKGGIDLINSDGKSSEVGPIFTQRYKGPLLEIEPFVSPFNSFSVTPNHPVYCIRRSSLKKTRRTNSKCDWLQVNHQEVLEKKPEFVQAKNLTKSDYLVFPKNRIVKDNPFYNKKLMRLIGYYTSEGYTCANMSVVAFAFNKKENLLINEVENLIFYVTGKSAKKRTRKNVTEVYVCSRKFARLLTKCAARLARKKCLSPEIMKLPYEKQKHLIDTHLDGDGDSYRRRPSDSRTYRIVTVSKDLAIQFQEILARGGIFASIREVIKEGHSIEGRMMKPSKQFLLSFKGKRKHNFVRERKNCFLVPVRKISKKPYQGMVYNCQVFPEPNTYLVKGFAVHNCGAAIATSSMVTELVKGKSVDEAIKVSNHAVSEALGGLPKIKMHCSVLAEDALKKAIQDYREKEKNKK